MVPETVVIVELPAPWASVTVWPATGLAKASLAVTVTVEVATPFAVTEPGAALTVELVGVDGARGEGDGRGLGDRDGVGRVGGGVGGRLGDGVLDREGRLRRSHS